MQEHAPLPEDVVAREQQEASLKEATFIPCVQEALHRAEALGRDELGAAVMEDKQTSHGSWSARDYAAQRLTAIRGLQQLIDTKKMLGKDVAEFETSLRVESDRLARFLLTREQWAEPNKELLPEAK